MTIIETAYTVSQHGTLKISRKALSGMGLQPGDTVRVAYLSDDGQANIFREFLLSKDGVLIHLLLVCIQLRWLRPCQRIFRPLD